MSCNMEECGCIIFWCIAEIKLVNVVKLNEIAVELTEANDIPLPSFSAQTTEQREICFLAHGDAFKTLSYNEWFRLNRYVRADETHVMIWAYSVSFRGGRIEPCFICSWFQFRANANHLIVQLVLRGQRSSDGICCERVDVHCWPLLPRVVCADHCSHRGCRG